jgi:hypothetical protein
MENKSDQTKIKNKKKYSFNHPVNGFMYSYWEFNICKKSDKDKEMKVASKACYLNPKEGIFRVIENDMNVIDYWQTLTDDGYLVSHKIIPATFYVDQPNINLSDFIQEFLKEKKEGCLVKDVNNSNNNDDGNNK